MQEDIKIRRELLNKQEKILGKVAAHLNPNIVKQETTNQQTKNEALNHQAQYTGRLPPANT